MVQSNIVCDPDKQHCQYTSLWFIFTLIIISSLFLFYITFSHEHTVFLYIKLIYRLFYITLDHFQWGTLLEGFYWRINHIVVSYSNKSWADLVSREIAKGVLTTPSLLMICCSHLQLNEISYNETPVEGYLWYQRDFKIIMIFIW